LVRFQVRKRSGRWEVWAFLGKFWDFLDDFPSFEQAMVLATGQTPYREMPGLIRTLRLTWRP
jgi:hypothetical protein